jgi:anti-anti-sigma factor
MIKLQDRATGELTVLSVSGSLQSSDNPVFAEKLRQLQNACGGRVILDAAGLEYINSQAIADLMVFYQKVSEKGGQLALAGLQPIVDKVVRAVGLSELVTIFPSLSEAESVWS